ncbi:OmpA family protein [Roseinatronobacter alkalisoli]|uniref:OmpA family protein n=1 Tax=Roseinatronobacter alkalisoli TaxID=3028235 RepID=A0ABT5TDR0_9RHOB|nr:OmpA family protein [Roseinatronobacter sp. HJB301]MDD7973253.1 OmpA family protein [Roseinatronobacter sp. HJB301]
MFRSTIAVVTASLIAALCLTVAAQPVMAQPAIEDAAPHPMVPLPAEGYITRDDFTDFAEIEFLASPHPGGREPEFEETLQVEGAWRQMEYTVDGLELSLLRLYRGYLQHFESSEFETIFSGIGEELSIRDGFTFISYQSGFLSRTPSTTSESNAYILVRSPDEQTIIGVSFFSRQNARRMIINAVEIEEMAPLDLFSPAPEPEQEQEPEVVMVPQEVEELESGLVRDGRVIVNAILFEFDRAEILPESARALGTVADLLRNRPELKLLVVGHTDGVGSFDYNLRLSVERAQAVVSWLGNTGGIDSARLRAAGAGPMSPITTNRTENGRAQNRRVELVEIFD